MSNNPFPNNKIVDSSKLEKFADGNFKFAENGIKFSKPVENTVGKGKIARYEQLLIMSNISFSPSVFERPILQTRKNQGLFGKGLNGHLAAWNLHIDLKICVFDTCYLSLIGGP